MPVIPEFEANAVPTPAAPPRADPQAFAVMGEAMRQSGQVAEQAANSWAQTYAEAYQQRTAAKAIADGTQQLNDLSFNLGKMPDSQAAYSQFNDQAAQIKQKILAGLSDPMVQAHVDSQLSQYSTIKAETTRHAAFGVEASTNLADIQGKQLPQYAGIIANSNEPTERAYALDQIKSNLASAAHAGWITPDAALTLQSQALKSAVKIKMADDPIAAQSLLDGIRSGMTITDQADADEALRNAVPRRQAENIAASVWNGGGGALDQGTAARAEAVRQGMIARGVSPDEAVAWAANAVRESGANPASAPTAQDSGRGIFRWTSPERIAAFRDKYGVNPEQAPLGDQLDFALAEKAGTLSAAGAKIDQAQGPAEKAKAISDYFLIPSDPNGAEAAARGGLAQRLASGGQPDIATQLEEVRARTANLPVAAQEHAETTLLRHWHDGQLVLSGQRGDLERNVSNLEQAYMNGETDEDPPVDDIRRFLPPDKADQVVSHLAITRQAGDLFNGVRYASPQQEQDALSLLATPGSLAAGKIIVRNKQVVPPPDSDSAAPAPETPDQMKLRTAVFNRYQALLAAKHKALDEDPAGYAATQPDAAAAIKAINADDPATRVAAANKLLDVQTALGVPEARRRVLTNSQAGAIVQQLTSGDPAKTDIGAQLDQLKAQYGDLWPHAFGDLVQAGHLSPDWQVVANMTDPAQLAARADMVRTLQTMAQPEGLAKLEKAVPQTDRATIDKNLPDDLAPFRATIMAPGGAQNMGLYNAVAEAVRGLAYTNALKGQQGEEALSSAVTAVLNARYDFDSDPGGAGPFALLRTPKGMMPLAQQLGRQRQDSLTAADILPPAQGNPKLTPQQNAEVVADAARRSGQWVVTPRDDGAVLMAKLRDSGALVPVIRRDGTPVSMKWSELAPTGSATPPVSVSAMPQPGSQVAP